MTERTTIELPEICRVEGHSAVTVDVQDDKVTNVQLNVFEGTRFFEQIVIGHKYDELPHLTSRVCAICSTGHIVAAIQAVERIFEFIPSKKTKLFRELMHLGMIIESHATHICALALPDFLDIPDLMDFASSHEAEFNIWTKLRGLGALIQTTIGGRPFHPVNLHVGKLSHHPQAPILESLLKALDENLDFAIHLCGLLAKFPLPIAKTAPCTYLALVPESNGYGFFGNEVLSSDGNKYPIDDYKKYLDEKTVAYSHSKQSRLNGKPFMVGAMARLHLFGERLSDQSRSLYENSPLSQGDENTIWNNLAQAIEIVEAVQRSKNILHELIAISTSSSKGDKDSPIKVKNGQSVGAVECPRGTLYHFYELDNTGKVIAADMITPSAQNSARIEEDIRMVAEAQLKSKSETMKKTLGTLIRAYDPCNTCATHMVEIRYANQ